MKSAFVSFVVDWRDTPLFSLTERRINADRLLRVFERLWQRDKFCVRKGAIVVSARIAGVSFDALSITLHRTRKVSLLKQSISFLARYSWLRRVNVRSTVCGCLGTLNILKLVQNIGRAVFSEGFFEEPDCVG
jgi:hypothetical protein